MGEDGRIVLISSTAGQRGEAEHSAYAATKGALISYTKSLAAELGPRGIRVNCVAPGWVEVESHHRKYEGYDPISGGQRVPRGHASRGATKCFLMPRQQS